MVLDPKYADLPWIAHDQPDVYEAGELPEVDQRQQMEDVENVMMPKEIETIKLSVGDAHKRFSKCKVDSSNVDFSDSIAGRGKIGYTIEADEYEVLPPGAREHETLLSRLQRLQTEVNQLVSDSSDVSKQTKSTTEQNVNPSDLSRLAEVLRGQLQQLQLSEDFNVEPNLPDAQSQALYSKIIAQLDNFKPDKNEDRKVTDSSHLVYEIYDRPDFSKKAEVERVAELDRRLQRLEALIGQPDPTKLSALTADTVQHSLLEAASRLSARSSLLQPSHLDMIETRLSSLQTKLQSITEKREAIADADTQNKARIYVFFMFLIATKYILIVAELYELVKKWNDVADSLPMIVERLTELKDLHEEASDFSNMLNTVESEQKTMEENLNTYLKLLEEVRKSLDENMQTVKQNFESLNDRLK
ncbi:Dynactin subunit 2-B [Fasciola hepatica]|uniref:Dynactin subunit 2-B n=1 Tax=Fasciola hepatica TaxID=6192 RepID=A0A4E0RE24_FASHE|nr:Dynactin subunit 2-B [Fasciola hepatica]